MSSLKFSRKQIAWAIGSIVVLGFILYANSLHGEFVWDDEGLVQNNTYIKHLSNIPSLFVKTLQNSPGEANNFYRPLQMLTYASDYSFWKMNVFGYHLTNVLLHVAVALALFFLARALFLNELLAYFAALFFVAHPIHTEAVSYISGRADPLAAFFMLVSFIFYLKFSKKASIKSFLITATTFILALFSRENSLMFLALLLLYHYAYRKNISKRLFSTLVAISILYLCLRAAALAGAGPLRGSGTTPWDHVPGFLIALWEYLRLMLLPHNLHMEYGGLLFDFSEPRVFVGILVLLVSLTLAFINRKKNPSLFFCITWFFLLILPYSNLYPLNAYMAEHWLYLPSMGYFFLLGSLTASGWEKERFRLMTAVIATTILIFYGVSTFRQNKTWKDSVSLYESTLKFSPTSSRLYNNLSKAYHDTGKNEELLGLLQRAVEIDPQNIEAYNNLGNAYKKIGKVDEAIASYKKAMEINPKHPGPYYNLGTLNRETGKIDDAAILFQKAIEVDPRYAYAYFNLALIDLEKGKKDEAMSLLKKANDLNPDSAPFFQGLGYAYFQLGDTASAIQMYEKALQRDPGFSVVYHDLAVIYYNAKDYKTAIRYYDKAVLLGREDPDLSEGLKPYR